MYRFSKGSLLVLVIFLLFVGFSQAAIIMDDNILPNSGFEFGPLQWELSEQGMEIVDNFSFAGNRSLKISSDFKKARSISSAPQEITYTSNTRYLFTINYFTTSAEGDIKLKVNLYRGEKLLEVIDLGVLSLTRLNQWITNRFLIDIPDLNPVASAFQICVEVAENYHGDLWLDDLLLHPVLPGKNMIANSGFEASNPKEGWEGVAGLIEKNDAHSGNASGKLQEDPSQPWNCIYTNTRSLIPYREGDTVRTTFYYKLDKKNDANSLEARLRFVSPSGWSDYQNRSIGNAEIGQWTKYTFEQQYTKQTQGFNFYLFAKPSFKGNVLLDDVEILLIPEEKPKPVVAFVCNRIPEQPDKIICQWQGNEKRPFRYNIYMAQEAEFKPDFNNLVASVSGNLTNYIIEIPRSRVEDDYYLAISAIDEGGQESSFIYADALAGN